MRHGSILALVSFVTVSAALSGCAHAPAGKGESPDSLASYSCQPGSAIHGVKGSAWMKAKSKEASGQFPVSIEARAPDHLRLEVTNLVGATEAVISVDGKRYRIDLPSRKGKPGSQQEGSGTWGGIPLRWAQDLFVGRIPCPSAAAMADARKSVTPEGDLVIETTASLDREPETYSYRFRKLEGHPWPESLHWERKGSVPLAVDFKFDDPEDRTLSPRKWEAKSSRGEVKVRWKEREIQS